MINSDEICDLYKSEISIVKISNKFNISISSIRKILIDNNIKIRHKYSHFQKRRESNKSIDLNYFNIIDSHEKAYWLGIISSDGTISKDGYKISLTSKDEELILNFKKAIKSEHKISEINSHDKRTNKIYHRYLIQIASKDFVKNIVNLGVITNKSYISFFPKISNIYYNSFIRGLFDGDGSVSVISKNSIRMDFTASKEILNFIQNYFFDNFEINKHKIYRVSSNMNTFRTHYFSSANTMNILSFIYENSTESTRLHRKYKKYLEFVQNTIKI